MENYAYTTTSYPESGDSSPRSREMEFENPPPWDDQQQQLPGNFRVKFMCSYRGKINPRAHDNQLSYAGGETKILAVERSIKFAGFMARLSALCDGDVSFKYQLPGEDLDALISVTNDDDLEHMMHEYDRLYRASSKPARLRLFLFPVNQPSGQTGTFSSSEARSDRDRFVDALNSAPIQPSNVSPANNVDFLLNLEKGMKAPPPPPPVATKVQVPIPELAPPEPVISASVPDDRAVRTDLIQRQIQDLQWLHIAAQQQQPNYQRKSDDNVAGGFPADFYAQKAPEKVAQPVPIPVAAPASAPVGYWPEKHVAGGVYRPTPPGPEQSVYMIPTQAGAAYHAPQVIRQMTGSPGQGFFALHGVPSDVYREQRPAYSVVPPMPPAQAAPSPALASSPVQASAPPAMQQQAPARVSAYSEGIAMARATTAGLSAADTGYLPMAYYTASPAGGLLPPPSPYQPVSAAVTADMRQAGVLKQDGKIVL